MKKYIVLILMISCLYGYGQTKTMSVWKKDGTWQNYKVSDVDSISFSSIAPTTVKDKSGNVYNIVNVNGQKWLKENLKTTKFNDGSTINTNNPLIWQWPCYGNDTAIPKHGRLYTAGVVTDSRGVCPVGFHVATRDDYWVLLGYHATCAFKIKDSLGTPTFVDRSYLLRAKSGWTSLSDPGWDYMGLGFYPTGYYSTSTKTFNMTDKESYLWEANNTGTNISGYAFKVPTGIASPCEAMIYLNVFTTDDAFPIRCVGN